MKLAQTLYEAGHITYMRTDSTKYSTVFIGAAKAFIMSHWDVGKEYLRKRMGLISGGAPKKKNAQEAHEAIRPTHLKTLKLPTALGAAERKLYDLIWKNTVESCMSEAKVNHISVRVTAPQEHHYTHTAHSVVFPGWLIVSGYERSDGEYDIFSAIKKKKEGCISDGVLYIYN